MTLKPARVHSQAAFITHATAEAWVDAAGATIGYHRRENHDIVRCTFANSVLCLTNDAALTVIVAWIWIDVEVCDEARRGIRIVFLARDLGEISPRTDCLLLTGKECL